MTPQHTKTQMDRRMRRRSCALRCARCVYVSRHVPPRAAPTRSCTARVVLDALLVIDDHVCAQRVLLFFRIILPSGRMVLQDRIFGGALLVFALALWMDLP